jgi:hypothetical protein
MSARDPTEARARGIRMMVGLPPEEQPLWSRETGPDWRISLVRRRTGPTGHGGGLVLRTEWRDPDIGWLPTRYPPHLSRAAMRSLAPVLAELGGEA